MCLEYLYSLNTILITEAEVAGLQIRFLLDSGEMQSNFESYVYFQNETWKLLLTLFDGEESLS